MISDFPDLPYSNGGGMLAESAVKLANPRRETNDGTASRGSRKEYGYRAGRSLATAQSGSSWNMALGKPASQSSTAWGGDASRGVDGNTSGNWDHNSATHTGFEHQPWWQVDIGGVEQIGSIVIWNLTSCCSERLSNFYVLVSDNPFSSTDLTTTINQTGVSSYYVAGPVGTLMDIGVNRSGRYVRVQLAGDNYLHMAEVEVLRAPSGNLALGKPASQSSTAWGGNASRGVDGNTSGNWDNNSATHTDFEHQPWWQVDLGGVQQVDTVRIWNLTSCCSERLSNFYVLVSDNPFSSTDLTTTINQTGVSSYYVAGPVGTLMDIGVNRSGRYVRVQLAGDNYLHMAEVEVLGYVCQTTVAADRWKGEYYSNTNLSGNPARVRDDGTGFLNFNWGGGSPCSACGLGVNNFSARWTRTVNFASGTYRFTVGVDNGVRLYVDGQLTEINHWANLPPNTYTADVALSAGNHEIKLEFVEYTDGAFISLSWAPVCQTTVAANRWKGEYFNNQTLQGSPVMVRDDGNGFLNLNFGGGSPSSACNVLPDNFSARWTRTVNLAQGIYRFSATVDDGVRLYVDGYLRIDQWGILPNTYTADVFLSAGDHEIRLEFLEASGGALASLSWTTVSGVNCNASVPTDRWKGEYYSNTNLSGSAAMVRDDGTGFLNMNFGGASPNATCGLGVDYFSARWTRTVNFTSAGLYRFTATVDNGVRLYVDGQLKIDQWGDLPPNTYTAEVFLTEAPHQIKIEFVEFSGGASANLSWAPLTPGDLSMALIDPINRIGSPGKDLLSRNCNWSLPLLSLPGRAGLDLGLALTLNSLIYTRAGSVIHFDPTQGFPAPGFTLGFPEIRNTFFNTEAGAQSYLLEHAFGPPGRVPANQHERLRGCRFLVHATDSRPGEYGLHPPHDRRDAIQVRGRHRSGRLQMQADQGSSGELHHDRLRQPGGDQDHHGHPQPGDQFQLRRIQPSHLDHAELGRADAHLGDLRLRDANDPDQFPRADAEWNKRRGVGADEGRIGRWLGIQFRIQHLCAGQDDQAIRAQ